MSPAWAWYSTVAVDLTHADSGKRHGFFAGACPVAAVQMTPGMELCLVGPKAHEPATWRWNSGWQIVFWLYHLPGRQDHKLFGVEVPRVGELEWFVKKERRLKKHNAI